MITLRTGDVVELGSQDANDPWIGTIGEHWYTDDKEQGFKVVWRKRNDRATSTNPSMYEFEQWVKSGRMKIITNHEHFDEDLFEI